MTIAREEIFGPVLAMMPYDTEEEAIAHRQRHGLRPVRLRAVGQHRDALAAWPRRMRTGMVHLNGAGPDFGAPFGGYKQSGNGREWGEHGFQEFLEVKAVMGSEAA